MKQEDLEIGSLYKFHTTDEIGIFLGINLKLNHYKAYGDVHVPYYLFLIKGTIISLHAMDLEDIVEEVEKIS